MNLLHAAGNIQLNHLDLFRIVKIRYGGVVKRDMAVFADAEEHHVGRVLFQKLAVTRAFLLGIRRAVDQVNGTKRNTVKNRPAEKTVERLRAAKRKTDIFVHMKRVDAFPW